MDFIFAKKYLKFTKSYQFGKDVERGRMLERKRTRISECI